MRVKPELAVNWTLFSSQVVRSTLVCELVNWAIVNAPAVVISVKVTVLKSIALVYPNLKRLVVPDVAVIEPPVIDTVDIVI